MKKKFLKTAALTLSVVMAASALAGCSNSSNESSSATGTSSIDPSTVSGSANMWTWDTSEKDVIAKFEKAYPNIKINLVSVNYDDYMNKVQTCVAGGSELGDILCGEYNFRAQLFKMDILENLEEAPYNVKRDDIMDYEIPLCTYNDKVVGLEGSMSIGGIAYKADLAKKYLGTDDVKTLEGQFKSWDDVIEAGKKVQEASNGSCYLIHSWADVQEILDCAGQDALTEDGKATDYLTNTMPEERYKILTEMLKNKVFDPAVSDHYTPAMNSAVADDNHIMLDSATWTSAYVIEPNDADGKGRWREMEAPGGAFNCGGTTYSIYKDSKNKDAAWSYIKWAFGSEEGGEANLAARGFFPPYKPLVDSHDYSKDTNEWFAPQALTEKFYKEMEPDVKVRAPEYYSNQIKAAYKTVETAVINDKTNSITLDKYKALVKEQLQANCPDLEF